jgi:hypothetical protein
MADEIEHSAPSGEPSAPSAGAPSRPADN